MKKKILFVDDEPKILQGLKRAFHEKQCEWDMVFAPGGKEALEELSKSHFDVVVSDMRMPQIDGAVLLKEVKDRYPHIVRIILSGYAEIETTLRAVPVAHQFLSKPCDPRRLEEIIEQISVLQAMLNSELLKNLIGRIDSLPTFPKIYQALTEVLSKPESSLQDLSAIIERDMAMSAKVLQLVNSSFFGLSHRITSVASAVTFLGLNMLKNLTLSLEVFRVFEGKAELQGFSLEQFQRHAILTAHLAKKMFKDPRSGEDAFIAGMLHDIGKLLMMAYFPDESVIICKEMKAQGKKRSIVEKDLLGVTHAEMGAYLLGIWGVPYSVVEAIANHHTTVTAPYRKFDIVSAIYVANRLVNLEDDPREELETAYLQGLGVLDQVPIWKGWLQELKIQILEVK